MNTKHTPGPWKVFRTGAGELDSITTTNGLRVAGTVTFYGNNQGEANASLIAAAPELLEALELYVRPFAALSDSDLKAAASGSYIPLLRGTDPVAVLKARFAIAKATGQQ